MSSDPTEPDTARPPATPVEVEQGTVGLLGKQGRFRATVRLVEHGGARFVAKDYRACTPLYRWSVGAWNIRRERRALDRLRGLDGIPSVCGMAGRWILLMTHFRGKDLGKTPKAHQTAEFFDRLLALVREMHARGVVHLDLRQRRNVLVRPGGLPAVLDFGASLTLSAGGWLLRRLARVDESGVLKYKERATPESLTNEEVDMLDRARRRRKYWPFG